MKRHSLTPPPRCQSGRYDRHVLITATASEGTRLLLLGALRHGVPEVRRAQTWPADTPRGALLAAISAAYRGATNLSSTHVVLASVGLPDLAPLLRRAVGPMASIESRGITALDWKELVSLGLDCIDPECTEDDEYVAVLTERAIIRGGTLQREACEEPLTETHLRHVS